MKVIGEVDVQTLIDAGIGPMYHEAMLSSVSSRTSAKEVLTQYCAGYTRDSHRPLFLVIYGPYGTGKTSAAVSLCKHALMRNMGVMLVTAAKIAPSVINEPGFLKEISTVDLLVIDNLNDEMTGKWSQTSLEDILRDRYSYNRRTIITTNLVPARFKEAVNGAVISLINHVGEYVLLNGTRWRTKKGAKNG